MKNLINRHFREPVNIFLWGCFILTTVLGIAVRIPWPDFLLIYIPVILFWIVCNLCTSDFDEDGTWLG